MATHRCTTIRPVCPAVSTRGFGDESILQTPESMTDTVQIRWLATAE
jgi:hypothetical protein